MKKCLRLVVMIGCSCTATNPVIADAAQAPQEKLEQVLKIEWEPGPDLPQGFQDSDGGILHRMLITVGGFCSGGLEEDNRRKPGKHPRGFLKKAWGLDLSQRDRGWRELPEFPGAARQGLTAVVVDDVMYFWGGFSYAEPYCYDDGWCLKRTEGNWLWTKLPSLPWKITSFGMCVVGSKIYAMGGADYDAQAFYTEADRDGKHKRLGSRLLVIDTKDLDAGWHELPACPGTPRWVHCVAHLHGKIYVIGGATGNTVRDGKSYGYCTVVDNWTFDPETEKWTRIRDLPVSSGNFPRSSNPVYADRYILLPGGHQYGCIVNPDGTVRDKYGKASQRRPESGLHNDCFVYDTRTNLFGTADPLPIDNNLPMTVVYRDEIFLVGGETGGGVIGDAYYGHHPDLLLVGTIRER